MKQLYKNNKGNGAQMKPAPKHETLKTRHGLLALLALFMLLALVPAHAFAYSFKIDYTIETSSGTVTRSLYYNILNATNHTVELTYPNTAANPWDGYPKPLNFLNLSPTVEYGGVTYTVTRIGDNAFYTCDEIYSITIPSTIEYIGQGAFSGCSWVHIVNINSNAIASATYTEDYNLKNIFPWFSSEFNINWYFGDEVTAIGPYAMYSMGTNTFSVILPPNLTTIGEAAFKNSCYLHYNTLYNQTFDLNLPASLTSIGAEAFFGNTQMQTVKFNSTSVSIGADAFKNCTNLQGIRLENNCDIAAWCGFNFANEYANPLSYAHHFSDNSGIITELTIPSSVNHINSYAFVNYSDLTSITFQNPHGTIGADAFKNCDGLTMVDVGNLSQWCGVSFANEYANPLTYAHKLYVNGNHVTSLNIPSGPVLIKPYAFSGASHLDNVTLPSSVRIVGHDAFLNCTGLTRVFVNDMPSWCSIDFANAYANPLTYAHSIWSAPSGGGTYKLANDGNWTSPNNVYLIGRYAFSGWTDLHNLTIGANMDEIENNAFYGCTNLTSVTINSDLVASKNYSFDIINGVEQRDSFLSRFGAQVTSYAFGPSVTRIGTKALHGCSNVTSLTLSNGLVSIGEAAFYNCQGLTSVAIPSTVTTIETTAFLDCSGLQRVNITDLSAWCRINFASEYANPLDNPTAHHLYLNNNEITALVIPSDVTSIGSYAFWNCEYFTSVEIPSTVTSIGYGAFKGCSRLTSLTIPSSVTSIGAQALQGCTGLQELYVHRPTPPTILGPYAFSGIPTDIPVHVPMYSVTAYQTHQYWSYFTNYVGMPDVAAPYLQEFEGSTIPEFWRSYLGSLEGSSSPFTATLTPESGRWQFGPANGVFDGSRHAYVNIGGYYHHFWLVSPVIDLGSNANMLSFDLALTQSSGNMVPVIPDAQDNTRIFVLVSPDYGATWIGLQSWKHEMGYTDLEGIHPEGYTCTYNLSAYANQEVLIGFYMECTNADDASNRIHIDNFNISSFDPTLPPTAVTVSEVAGHSAKVRWTSQTTVQYQWDVVVASPNTTLQNNLTQAQLEAMAASTNNFHYEHVQGDRYKTMTELAPDTDYKAWVRYNDGTYTSPWVTHDDPSTFHTQTACAIPTNLQVEVTQTTAFVTWDPGQANQTSWYTYCDIDDIEGETVYEPFRLITGLEPGEEYEIQVTGYCEDNDGDSETVRLVFTTLPLPSLTLNNGTATSYTAVINAYETSSNYASTQFVIPASQLTGMQYSTIQKMQFYCSNVTNGTPWGNAQFRVYLKEVDFSNYSEFCDDYFYPWGDMSSIYDGSLHISNGVMTIEPLEIERFHYQGGDLLVGIYQYVAGSSGQAKWYGVTMDVPMSGHIESQYDTDMVQCSTFAPKVTFTYEPDAYLPPTNLVATPTAPDQVTLTWTMRDGQTATDVQLYNANMDEQGAPWITPNSVFGLGNLDAGTTYYVKIRGRYSVNGTYEYSAWTAPVQFTMPEACAAPTSLQATASGLSATLTWEGQAEAYEVEYCEPNILIDEDFQSSQSYPSGWTTSTTFPTPIPDGVTVWEVVKESLTNWCLKSATPNTYNSTYENRISIPVPSKKGVLIFRAKKDNIGVISVQVSNDNQSFTTIETISNSSLKTTYQYFTIDLTGQNSSAGYIAFMQSSGSRPATVYVDNIVFETLGNWASAGTTTENSMTLDGLTPGTTYLAYVRGNCDTGFNSEWALSNNFTISEYIEFEDENVEALCVETWGSNGRLSYAEAAAVTTLNPSGEPHQSVFRGNTTLTSFNELQYFTNLTVIDDHAFAGCANLQEITLPADLVTIGEYAFGHSVDNLGYPIGCTSLHSIVLPEGLTTIGSYAFSHCGLESLDLPNSVTTIGQLAFERCPNLESIYLPASVTTFTGFNPFAGCDLSSITVDLYNPVFDSRNDCNAIIQTASNTLVTGCKNTVIPGGVTSIGVSAFDNITGLTSINLPSTLTSIDEFAFMNCSGLTAIYADCTPPTIQSNSFLNIVPSNVTVYVPCSSIETYQNYNNTGSPWGGFANIVGEGCQITYTLASGWNWWAPFEGNTADELMQSFDDVSSSIVGDLLINSQYEGFLHRTDGTWDGTLTSIEPGKMYKVLTVVGGSFTFNGEHPTSVTVELQPGYTWFGFIGTDGTDIATLLTPADGDQLIRLAGDTYITYTYNGQVWTDGTYNVDQLTLQRGRGYIYHSTSSQPKTFIMNP